MKVSEIVRLFEAKSKWIDQWKLNKEGKLEDNIVISHFLTKEGQKINHNFVTENLIDDHDIKKLADLENKKDIENKGRYDCSNCPTLFKGKSLESSKFSEKFLVKNRITIKNDEDENENKSLTITYRDLQNFNSPRSGGAYGSIHFLEDYELECCNKNNKNDQEIKNSLVVKIQERNFDLKDVTGDIADRCFAYSELTRLQNKKIYRKTHRKYSNLYQGHFYASLPTSQKSPEKFYLYIVIRRCKIILDDLIAKVHNLKPNHSYDNHFVVSQKFPTRVLVSLCQMFFNCQGFKHNDLKPTNIGVMIKNGQYKMEYIDLGSMGSRGSPDSCAAYSIYPATLLYLSNTKVPDYDCKFFENFLDSDDDEMNTTELVEENKHITATVKETCKKAKGNFGEGRGDNLWAKGLVLRECMEGQHPAMKNGQDLDSIFETLKTTDFYTDFIQSKVYDKFYKTDPEFEPVRRFLQLAFERDAEKREANCFQLLNNEREIFDGVGDLRGELSKYYDLE